MGTDLDMKVLTEAFRKNFPIIIAINRHQATLLPMRVEYLSGGYFAGQVMAKRTSTGLFAKYNDAGSDGVNTATSILFEDIEDMDNTDAPSGSQVARGIFGGTVYKTKLIGLDAAAITDLGAKTLSDSIGPDLLKF